MECFRKDAPGLVELWPLYKDTIGPKNLFWPLVEEFQTEKSAYSLLALDIAKFIKNYIDSGAILPSTNKPARPEDFMILIRRRNQFTHEIIASLKEMGIFVAGIDRMMIMQHLSVQDIVTIAKFILLPEDDLNLAELLRSPIFALDDAALHNISTKRVGSLYLALNDKNILQLLNYFRAIGEKLSAFDFLHHIIDIMGYRAALKTANGEGSDDVLDELLNLACAWRNKNNDNLQEFIYWLEKREIEIKRDVTSSSSVRVMTVHAAKGLESPVVILPDTTSMPQGRSNFLWKNGNFLWLRPSQHTNIIHANYKSEIEDKDYEEYLRLLYVATTRAEDHLVIAGFQTQEKENADSWYGLAASAMSKLCGREEGGRRYYGESPAAHAPSLAHPTSSAHPPSSAPLQPSSSLTRGPILSPSYIHMGPRIKLEDDGFIPASYSKSPLSSRMDISYGSILHKILEDSVKTRNFTFQPSHPYIETLPLKMREPVIAKLSELFIMQEFIALTQYPTLKTEISIGYMENEILKIGRIDLVAISDEEVVIIDYKTDSNPPYSPQNIDERYKAQLKFYTDSIKKIMPNHRITAKILWLENLSFMDCSAP